MLKKCVKCSKNLVRCITTDRLRKSKIVDFLVNMPKEKNRRAALKQRYPPANIYLQVVGNGGSGGSTAVCLCTDHSHYLFNCGEGTVRLSAEYKLKLSRVQNLFVTRKSWKNVAGMLGLSLNLVDAGEDSLSIQGPTGVAMILQRTRGFGNMGELTVEEVPIGRKHTDSVLTVSSYPLTKRTTSSERDEDKIEPDAKRAREDHDQDVCVVYVGKLSSRKGKLNLEKCLEKGVVKGPDLGKLKDGHAVTTPSGAVVLPEEVCEPDDPGPTFMVLECPTLEYLDSLVHREELKAHQCNEQEEQVAAVVVHFSPLSVMQDERYQKWMDAFPSYTNHILVNEINNTGGSAAVHRMQHQLHVLNPHIFPLLTEPGWHEPPKSIEWKVKGSVVAGNTMIKHSFRPKTGLQSNDVPELTPDQYVNEVTSTEGFEENYKRMTALAASVSRDKPEYPIIHFLGTGSAQANKVRNSSGILLTFGENCHMILDCGEGTYGQLLRFYGDETAGTIVRHLAAIFISHRHADHHMGLFSILKARKEEFERLNEPYSPVTIFGPKNVMPWLTMYENNYEPMAYLYKYVGNEKLLEGSCECEEGVQEALRRGGIREMKTCPANHVAFSCACSLTSLEGFKVTYSGDTMPSDKIVTLGKDSDILIHEATHEDGFEVEAKFKRHSTTGQAIQAGKDMNATFTILTHFSQRYAKIPVFSSNFTSSVGVAFDNMRIRPKDLNLLPIMNPVLKTMYHEHYQEMQDKAMKKLLRR